MIEVIDDRQTGETILDEALKMMKSSEKYGTGAWIDLMSGEFFWDCGGVGKGKGIVRMDRGGPSLRYCKLQCSSSLFAFVLPTQLLQEKHGTS